MRNGATAVPASVSAPASDVGSPQMQGSAKLGFALGLIAYLLWGMLPLYMKAVAHIPAAEVVAYRVLWSVPIAGLVLFVLGRTADVKAALRSPRTLGMAALTAAIISINWGVYVWAIAVDRTVETALGYYINPLVTVVMGAVFLGERFDKVQIVAVMLAVIAVVILTIEAGGLPWVSLVLAFSFAFYGYLKKTLPIGASQGFFLEVLLLTPPCLAYVTWLEMNGQGHFFFGETRDVFLLLAAGPATAIPLILYGFGARMLRISTIGLMQYISPTFIALIAVFVFGEAFGPDRLLAFGLIWLALIIYTWAMLFRNKQTG